MSFKKPTNSSESVEQPSSKAVNGEVRDHFGTNLVSDPWWNVDLQQPFSIKLIEIVTRYERKFRLTAKPWNLELTVAKFISRHKVVTRFFCRLNSCHSCTVLCGNLAFHKVSKIPL